MALGGDSADATNTAAEGDQEERKGERWRSPPLQGVRHAYLNTAVPARQIGRLDGLTATTDTARDVARRKSSQHSLGFPALTDEGTPAMRLSSVFYSRPNSREWTPGRESRVPPGLSSP